MPQVRTASGPLADGAHLMGNNPTGGSLRGTTPAQRAHRTKQKAVWKITPERAEAINYQRGLSRAAVAERAATKQHTASATVNGRSWWECDRETLNRRAAARFPALTGRLPPPNF